MPLLLLLGPLQSALAYTITSNDPALQTALGAAEINMDPDQERRLGRRLARDLYRSPKFLQDPVLEDYLSQTLQSLLVQAEKNGTLSPETGGPSKPDHAATPALNQSPRFAWRILLIKDKSANAFALPGGYIGVHSGLIALARSQDELAAVLAHELVHVAQRHVPRLLGLRDQQKPLLWATTLLGALAASKNPQAGSAILAAGQGLEIQQQLNFSRDMEREADRLGLAILQGSGYQGQAMVDFMEKLQLQQRYNDQGELPYLRTHPLSGERVADLKTQLGSNQSATNPGTTSASTALHTLMAARARHLEDDLTSPYATSTTSTTSNAPSPATPDRAKPNAPLPSANNATAPESGAEAAGLRPNLLAQYRLYTQAEALLASAPAQALQMAEQHLASAPLLAHIAAQASTRLGTALAPKSIDWLEKESRKNAPSPLVWASLAQLYQAGGRTARALEAQAETQAARFDYDGAIQRLIASQNAAQAQPQDAASAQHSAIIASKRKNYSEARQRQREEDKKDNP